MACLEALNNKKDVYCEKPITHLFAEGQAVYKAAAKNERIFQVGSQQRSDTRFRVAAEAVMNGVLGKIKEVKVGLPTGGGTDEEGKVAQPILITLIMTFGADQAECYHSILSVFTGTGAGALTMVEDNSWTGLVITTT